jgi:DNA-binding response OmpR family regulator
MMLQALLLSKDDQAAETLTRVLAQCGVAVDRSSAVEAAVARLSEVRFDQAIVDFDDPATASLVLETLRRQADAAHAHPAVTVALLPDASQIRSILGAGAHFILTKPVAYDQATATLRAATALLKRERRQSFRIPVQAPVSLRTAELPSLEGILLDVSAGGMDILAAQSLPSAALVHFSCELPPGTQVEGDAEVAWSSANGQSGLRFLDVPSDMREHLGEWLTEHAQQALPEEPDPLSQGKLTDLSMGGCYVETESPFPQASAVDLCLKAAGLEIHTEAVVRVMHPGHGMGIEFPARTEEQRKSVADFIAFLTSQPGATPELEISPRSLVAGSEELNPQAGNGCEFDDPLLELLRTGAALEQPEFLSELHRQRSSSPVS